MESDDGLAEGEKSMLPAPWTDKSQTEGGYELVLSSDPANATAVLRNPTKEDIHFQLDKYPYIDSDWPLFATHFTTTTYQKDVKFTHFVSESTDKAYVAFTVALMCYMDRLDELPEECTCDNGENMCQIYRVDKWQIVDLADGSQTPQVDPVANGWAPDITALYDSLQVGVVKAETICGPEVHLLLYNETFVTVTDLAFPTEVALQNSIYVTEEDEALVYVIEEDVGDSDDYTKHFLDSARILEASITTGQQLRTIDLDLGSLKGSSSGAFVRTAGSMLVMVALAGVLV